MLAALVLVIFLLIRLLGGTPGSPNQTPDPSDLLNLPEGTPEATPTPGLPENLSLSPVPETDPDEFGFRTDINVNREDVSSFVRTEPMTFGLPHEYTDIPGILTFAGNNYRNSFTYGTQTVTEQALERVWEVPTGSLNSWTGNGWTGQPAIVQWPEETRKVLGIKDEFKSMDGFTEVIYPAMDGKIYFIELSSGEQTREPIVIGATTKGSACIDPRGYPLLYTGQGLESTESDGSTGAWFRIIDLIENKVVWKFGGVDPFSHRDWQAYDSSALIDAQTDTLIAPGENGVVYTTKLNSHFDPEAGTVSVNPGPLEKYRYTGSGYGEGNEERWWGIENSMAVWRNYGFFSDNGGRLQCLDLNTFELQYVVDVTDDSDSSIVIEEDLANNTFYLYTANEVDKQSGALARGSGKSYHRKINGLTGEIIWEVEHKAATGGESSNGGTLSTPHVGKGSISDLVIYNATLVPVTYTDEEGNEKSVNGGRIIVYNKHTGEEVWRYEQASGYWSSPVVIYDEQENAYLIQCDRNGKMRMHDPRTGDVLFELDMGSRMEATPAVFDNMLVVGTRGTHGSGESQKIIGVKIK